MGGNETTNPVIKTDYTEEELSKMVSRIKSEAVAPTMGRIVIYNHPGSLDGKYKPMQSPGIVQHVNEDGTLFLWVFGPYGISFNPSIKQGNGPCEWNWPVRV